MAISKTSRALSLKALGGSDQMQPGSAGKVKPANPKLPKSAGDPFKKKAQPMTQKFSPTGPRPKTSK